MTKWAILENTCDVGGTWYWYSSWWGMTDDGRRLAITGPYRTKKDCEQLLHSKGYRIRRRKASNV